MSLVSGGLSAVFWFETAIDRRLDERETAGYYYFGSAPKVGITVGYLSVFSSKTFSFQHKQRTRLGDCRVPMHVYPLALT